MPGWSHPRSEVRRALDEADRAALKVTPTTARGHSWGYIDCTDEDCADPRRRYYVNSTPRSQYDEADRIRRFIRKHGHKKPGSPRQAAPGEGGTG
jgi:hypothetical protein